MNPYQFFLKHAGYSYNPQTQSPMQGRVQCARKLAAAERKARDAGVSYQWEIDASCDSLTEFAPGIKPIRGTKTRYSLWQCCAIGPRDDDYRGAGEVLASLGGIDFGRDGEPWGDPYRRVVEAELALEALDQLEGQS